MLRLSNVEWRMTIRRISKYTLIVHGLVSASELSFQVSSWSAFQVRVSSVSPLFRGRSDLLQTFSSIYSLIIIQGSTLKRHSHMSVWFQMIKHLVYTFEILSIYKSVASSDPNIVQNWKAHPVIRHLPRQGSNQNII